MHRAGLLLLLPACASLARERELAVQQGPAAAAAQPAAVADARATPEQIEAQTKLGLQVLHAQAVERQLEHGARLVVDEQPATIGGVAGVRVELRNAMGEEVALLRSPRGLAIVFTWSVDRWLPYGARDQQTFQRVARLASEVTLPPGELWYEGTELPLQMEGEPGALWDIRLQARLRCDGARLGERLLPVKDVQFQEARLLAFPDGWQALTADPLGGLRKALAYAGPEVDRHLLVCAALLPPAHRREALAALIEALPAPASRGRAAALTTALTWLSGERFGDAPAAWTAWWERQNSPEAGRVAGP